MIQRLLIYHVSLEAVKQAHDIRIAMQLRKSALDDRIDLDHSAKHGEATRPTQHEQPAALGLSVARHVFLARYHVLNGRARPAS